MCLLHPQRRGSVTLASPDPLVAPRIDPAFLWAPDDLTRLVRGFQRMRNLLAQPGAGGAGRARAGSVGKCPDARTDR